MRNVRSSRPPWSTREKNILFTFFEAEGVEGCTSRMKSLEARGAAAIKSMAFKMRLQNPRPSQALLRSFTDDQVEEVIRLHDEEKLGFKPIAEQFGVAETTASNAYYIAMCSRRGHRPAERDDKGSLVPAEIERLRAFLRKGTKPVDIQLFMGISAGCVCNERRQYQADLKARGKRPLPPPGNGERYAGAKIPKDLARRVEQLYLEGKATPLVSDLTGVSKTHCLRARARLLRRLKRRGELLPGYDATGKRISYRTVLRVPAASKAKLRELILARVPVRQAAIATGIGGCTAYKVRDELAAELALIGQQLPKPIRSGSAEVPKPWLPPQRRWWVLYRQLEAQHGHDHARATIESTIAAIASLPAALQRAIDRDRAARPMTFEEKLARIRAGAGIIEKPVLVRADPSFSGGGSQLAAFG